MAGGRNNPWIVIAFLSLYCATQGLYDAWDEAFELTYLTGYGVSLEYVGLTQTLAIVPWCFKVYVSMPSESPDAVAAAKVVRSPPSGDGRESQSAAAAEMERDGGFSRRTMLEGDVGRQDRTLRSA